MKTQRVLISLLLMSQTVSAAQSQSIWSTVKQRVKNEINNAIQGQTGYPQGVPGSTIPYQAPGSTAAGSTPNQAPGATIPYQAPTSSSAPPSQNQATASPTAGSTSPYRPPASSFAGSTIPYHPPASSFVGSTIPYKAPAASPTAGATIPYQAPAVTGSTNPYQAPAPATGSTYQAHSASSSTPQYKKSGFLQHAAAAAHSLSPLSREDALGREARLHPYTPFDVNDPARGDSAQMARWRAACAEVKGPTRTEQPSMGERPAGFNIEAWNQMQAIAHPNYPYGKPTGDALGDRLAKDSIDCLNLGLNGAEHYDNLSHDWKHYIAYNLLIKELVKAGKMSSAQAQTEIHENEGKSQFLFNNSLVGIDPALVAKWQPEGSSQSISLGKWNGSAVDHYVKLHWGAPGEAIQYITHTY